MGLIFLTFHSSCSQHADQMPTSNSSEFLVHLIGYMCTAYYYYYYYYLSNPLRRRCLAPAVNNFCPSFLSSAVLFSATYFPFVRSLSKCILFLPLGHPCNFQRVSREPNFAALNRGRHLYSAGRPSRWALAHIVVLNSYYQLMTKQLTNKSTDFYRATLC